MTRRASPKSYSKRCPERYDCAMNASAAAMRFAFTFAQTFVRPMSKPSASMSACIWVLVSRCFDVRRRLRFSSSDARILSRKSSISAFHLRGGDFLFPYSGSEQIDSAALRTASGGAPSAVIVSWAAR